MYLWTLWTAIVFLATLNGPVQAWATRGNPLASRRQGSAALAATPDAADGDTTTSNDMDCAVVGVGVLGTSLCRQILQDPALAQWTVTGVTQTTTHHDDIRQSMPDEEIRRFRLTTREALAADAPQKFTNVVFCAPPSGSTDYPADVKDAIDTLWTGSDGGGIFCFTSSGGVYTQESGIVTETTPIAETTPRTERLLGAEKHCLEAGGCVLRLAGLYLLNRGAHGFYMKSGDKPIAGNPEGVVNQLHYDDAAGACLAALQAGPSVCRGQIFLISDGAPQTRRQICESALKSAAYRDYAMPTFASEPDPSKPGKQYDGSFSNESLQWSPRHKSFDEFMKANA